MLAHIIGGAIAVAFWLLIAALPPILAWRDRRRRNQRTGDHQ